MRTEAEQFSPFGDVGASDAPTAGFSDGLRFLRRRKWVIAIGTLSVAGLAVLASSQLQERYVARSVLVFERSDTRLFEAVADFEREPIDLNAIETEMDVLQTRLFLGKVVDALGLVEDPAFNPYLLDDATLADRARTAAAALMGEISPTLLSPPPVSAPRASGEVGVPFARQRARAITELLAATTVQRSGQSLAVSIRVEQADPERAALIANTIGAVYIDWSLELKRQAAEGAYEFFRQRAQSLETRIAQLELEVLEFTEDNELAANPGQDALRAEIARLSDQLATVSAERSEAAARLRFLRDPGEAAGEAAAVEWPALARLRSDLETLRRNEADLAQSYGPRHPRMLALAARKASLEAAIGAERERYAEALSGEVAIANLRIAQLQERLDALSERERGRSLAEIRRRELENTLAFERRRFDRVLESLNTLDRQAEVLSPSARFLSEAEVPQDAAYPNIPVLTAGAGVAGAVMSTIGALLLEAFDTRVRSASRIATLLNVPTLAHAPRIRRRAFRRRESAVSLIALRPVSAFADAFKAVARGLERRGGRDAMNVILVTSALPSEGGATVSAGLAATLAAGGRRTLLLELDFTRGDLARELRVAETGPGLADVLDGGADIDAAIRTSGEIEGLDFLCNPNRAARLRSRLTEASLSKLLDSLRARYEVVVLDCPALLASPDAELAASFADSVLLAVRWGVTREETLRDMREHLANHPIRLMAAVLCEVHPRRHAAGRYGGRPQYRRAAARYVVE